MLLPTAALSLHPQCNPHNRLISAANVEQIFQTTKFLPLACLWQPDPAPPRQFKHV